MKPRRSPLRGLVFAVAVLLIVPATRGAIGTAAAVIAAAAAGVVLAAVVLSITGMRR